jgi:hypothetical protein
MLRAQAFVTDRRAKSGDDGRAERTAYKNSLGISVHFSRPR